MFGLSFYILQPCLQLGCFSLFAPGFLVLKSKPLAFDSLLLLYLAFYFGLLRLLRFLQSCSSLEFRFRPHRSRSRAHCCSQLRRPRLNFRLNFLHSWALNQILANNSLAICVFLHRYFLKLRSSTKRIQGPLPECSAILFEGRFATDAKPVRGNRLSYQRS